MEPEIKAKLVPPTTFGQMIQLERSHVPAPTPHRPTGIIPPSAFSRRNQERPSHFARRQALDFDKCCRRISHEVLRLLRNDFSSSQCGFWELPSRFT